MYETGQEVPTSGIYMIEHRAHRLPEEVMLVAGQPFPRCGKCSERVRFDLARSVPKLPGTGTIIVYELSADLDDDYEEFDTDMPLAA